MLRRKRKIILNHKEGKEMKEIIQEYEYFISLGYVTIVSSILTMIITQIIKKGLQKKKVITKETHAVKKDLLLSKIGRIVALLSYSILYIANEWITKKEIVLDKGMLVGLITGASLTLSVAKGMYSKLHQRAKRKEMIDQFEKNQLENQEEKWIIKRNHKMKEK